MDTYSILLPNEKAKTYRYITLFILLINCTVFGYMYFNTADKRTGELSSFGFLLSLIYIVMYFIKQYTKHLFRYRLEISFIVLGVLWLVLGNVIIALVLLICAIMGLYTTRDLKVVFTSDKITYPSFPPKTFSWEEVSNVILKDDVLTIDLKNNKLLQSTINPVEEISETGFNAFCRDLLSRT